MLSVEASAKSPFVTVKGHQLYLGDRPYYFVGTNYWYGSLLGLLKDEKRGVGRLRKELDFLKAHGVKNLRLLAGAEGSGRSSCSSGSLKSADRAVNGTLARLRLPPEVRRIVPRA